MNEEMPAWVAAIAAAAALLVYAWWCAWRRQMAVRMASRT